MRCKANACLLLIGLLLPVHVHANAVSLEAEYGKKIKAATEISALGNGMFGNKTSESNGNTVFETMDVSLPGNSSLPVQFGRRLLISTGTGYIKEELGGLGNWDVSVPYIEGVFSRDHGWAVAGPNDPNRFKRCSSTSATAIYTGNGLFSSRDVNSGYTIHIPGVFDGPMLSNANNHPNPSDGVSYPWVTSDLARISCIDSMKNGYPGEGFLLKTADGTKYFFDYAVEREAPIIRKAAKRVAGYSLPRKRIFLLATRIEDRFGNHVSYEYSGSLPVRISSNDGRLITSERTADGSVLVRANGRTWTYGIQNGYLRTVQLPDASRWEYDATGTYDARVEYEGEGYGLSYFSPEAFCSETSYGLIDSNERTNPDLGSFKVKHPSGATAVFEFVPMVFGRRGVPYYCVIDFFDHTTPKSASASSSSSSGPVIIVRAPLSRDGLSSLLSHPGLSTAIISFASDMDVIFEGSGGDEVSGMAHIAQPNQFETWSLSKVSITGPGMAPQVTSYRYLSQMFMYCDKYSSVTGQVFGYKCNEDPCADGSCEDGVGRWVETTLPSGDKMRRRFGVVYGINEGLLLEEQVVSAQGQLMRHVVYTHLDGADTSAQPFHRVFGYGVSLDPVGGADPSVGRIMPLKSTEIRESGESFISEVSSYDAFGRPLQVLKTNSMGHLNHRVDAIEYHDNFNLWVIGQTGKQYTLESGPNGRDHSGGALASSEVQYNSQALPWKVYKFGRLDATITYQADGTVATVADGKGNVTTFGDWKRGIPRHVRYPATPEAPGGATEMATVDDNGWITSITDEVDAITGYGYDTMGRLASIVQPTGDSVAVPVSATGGYHTTTRVFRALTDADWKPPGILTGQWLLYEQTGSRASVIYMDALWRPVLTNEYDTQNIDPTMRATKTRYDSMGRVSFASYPSSALIPGDTGTRTSYDALGRVTRVEQDSEHGVLVTATEYLPYLRTRVTNPRGHVTTNHFMAWDQPTYDFLILSQQPEGKVISIDRHPQFGWPLVLNQRNSSGTSQAGRRYVYDGHAQLCKTLEPETGATVMGYDAAGNPTWQASGLDRQAYGNYLNCDHAAAIASGRATTRTYDARNRLTHLTFPDGRGNQIWTYEKDNLPKSITAYNDANNATPVLTSYVYNKRRLLTGESITQYNGATPWYTWTIGYAYNGYGHLSTQTYPTGLVVDYAPNPLGQPTRAGTYATGAQYYPNGALKQFTYGNGIVHTMTQNARQLPAQVISAGVSNYTYNYDNNGNVTNIWDLARGDHYSRWLQYDQLDRLTAAGSGSFGGDAWHRMTYDALDNLKSWKLAGVKDYADYIYDAQNRLTNIRNTAGATVVGIDYDEQGNLRNKNGQGYVFDFGNRLRSATGKETYRYDGLGRRVQTTATNGKTTLWQYTQGGQMLFSSDWGDPASPAQQTHEHVYLAGSIVAIIDHAWPSNAVLATKYQHTDALGSPVAVTNASGQVIERMDYEPWGAIIGRPNHNGIGYTGHVMDDATGLTYMQQRYYDQSVGRFLSVDPVTADSGTGANFNRYKYAANSPYRFVDPDGRLELERDSQGRLVFAGVSIPIPDGLQKLMFGKPAEGSARRQQQQFMTSALQSEVEAQVRTAPQQTVDAAKVLLFALSMSPVAEVGAAGLAVKATSTAIRIVPGATRVSPPQVFVNMSAAEAREVMISNGYVWHPSRTTPGAGHMAKGDVTVRFYPKSTSGEGGPSAKVTRNIDGKERRVSGLRFSEP